MGFCPCSPCSARVVEVPVAAPENWRTPSPIGKRRPNLLRSPLAHRLGLYRDEAGEGTAPLSPLLPACLRCAPGTVRLRPGMPFAFPSKSPFNFAGILSCARFPLRAALPALAKIHRPGSESDRPRQRWQPPCASRNSGAVAGVSAALSRRPQRLPVRRPPETRSRGGQRRRERNRARPLCPAPANMRRT